jgi:hypothetical protein
VRTPSSSLAGLAVVLIALPFAAHASGQAIAPASGKEMCSALTPADFTKVGVPVSRLREANLDDEKSTYCVYDSAAGKVEMDIYFPAGDTPAEAQNAVRAAQAAIGGKFVPIAVAGTDEAGSNAASSGPNASIVVRRATTVFNISVPHNPEAMQQLVQLSAIVISRLKQ